MKLKKLVFSVVLSLTCLTSAQAFAAEAASVRVSCQFKETGIFNRGIYISTVESDLSIGANQAFGNVLCQEVGFRKQNQICLQFSHAEGFPGTLLTLSKDNHEVDVSNIPFAEGGTLENRIHLRGFRKVDVSCTFKDVHWVIE